MTINKAKKIQNFTKKIKGTSCKVSNDLTRAPFMFPVLCRGENEKQDAAFKLAFFRFFILTVHHVQKKSWEEIERGSVNGLYCFSAPFTEFFNLLGFERKPRMVADGTKSKVEKLYHWKDYACFIMSNFSLVRTNYSLISGENGEFFSKGSIVLIPGVGFDGDVLPDRKYHDAKTVKFSLHPEILQQIIRLKGNYAVSDIETMLSLHSYAQMRMYQYVCSYTDPKLTPKITLNDLKDYLGVSIGMPYKTFKQRYLIPIQKKLADTCNRTFEIVEEIKDRSAVVALKIATIKPQDYKGVLMRDQKLALENLGGVELAAIGFIKKKHGFQNRKATQIVANSKDEGIAIRALRNSSKEELERLYMNVDQQSKHRTSS